MECCNGKGRLYGNALKVSMVPFTPYGMFSRSERRIFGIDVDIVKTLAQKLNFKFRIQLLRSWDPQYENGTYGGMMGSVSQAF